MAGGHSFLDAAFQDLMDEDGLLVLARGLGKQRLLARFLRLQAESAAAAQGLLGGGTVGSATTGGAGFGVGPVLCLNMAGPADHQMLAHALKAEGLATSKLPRVIDNDVPKAQREAMYKRGGVYLVTSRILVVDMLSPGVIDVARIRGLVVNHAHRVTHDSTEAFIVRIYRQRNKTGFLKALTDEPEPLLQGFAKMEKVLRFLYLRKVYLWPRYHVAVKEYLARHEPEVVELAQALTPAMKAIQKAVLVCMRDCLQELKRVTTLSLEGDELTLANGITRAFHATLRRQLEPEWHRLSAKTKQLVEDLRVLRTLLDYLLRYDAVAFYSFLVALQRSNAQQRYPSPWLGSVAADRLFHHAKARVYRLRPIKAEKEKGKGSGKGKGGSELVLDVVLEEHPKWRLLAEVLAEIAREHKKGKPTPKPAPKEDGDDDDVMEVVTTTPAATGTTSGAASSSGGGTGSGSGKPKRPREGEEEEDGAPGVLVLLRDEMARAYLRGYLHQGGAALMQERFRHFLAQVQPVHKQILAGGEGTGDGDGGGSSSKGGKGGRGRKSGGNGGKAPAAAPTAAAATTGRAAVAAEEKRLLAEYFAGIVAAEKEAKKAAKARVKAAAAAAAAAAAEVVVLDDEEEEDPDATDEEEEAEAGTGWVGVSDSDSDGGGDKEGDEEDEGDASWTVSGGSKEGSGSGKGKGQKEKGVAAAAAAATGAKGKQPAPKGAAAKAKPKGRKGPWKKGRRGPVARVLRGLDKSAAASPQGGAAAAAAAGGKRKRPGEGGEVEEPTLARTEAFFLQQQQGGQGDGGGGDGEFAGAEGVRLRLVTYKEAGTNMALLDELQPAYVVLYDPDPQFVREVEVHQAARGDGATLRVYFCVYEESVEEQRYLNALTREKEAFERLVHEKQHMVMPTDVYADAAVAPRPGAYLDKLVADTRARTRGQPARPSCNKVVVDVREFRSSLPSLLHEAGIDIIPATLEVGDFVLTPEIVVERKSVSDLFGSFASGRLYTQVEAMLRHYKVATLLVEFQNDKAFALQTSGEISEEIQLTNICSKLALLLLKFPELRILWSRNSHCTVELFQLLKVNNAPVDVEKALHAGGGSGGEDAATGRNLAAQDFLLKLPGVNASNVRTIMNNVKSLAALAGMTQAELRELLESEANAKKLWEFLHLNPNRQGEEDGAGTGVERKGKGKAGKK